MHGPEGTLQQGSLGQSLQLQGQMLSRQNQGRKEISYFIDLLTV